MSADERSRCSATLWNTGEPCTLRAAPGFRLCRDHLSLTPPDQWSASGYGSVIADEDRALFSSAQFGDVSEELAVARLHLRKLLRENASHRELMSALTVVSNLVRLRQSISHNRAGDYLRRGLVC